MRSTIVLSAALAAASVAPAFAVQAAPAAIDWGTVGKDALKAAGAVAPFLLARDAQDELMARGLRGFDLVPMTTLKNPWRGEAVTRSLLARDIQDELIARAAAGSDAISWGTVGKDALKVAGTVAPLFMARDDQDLLMARAAFDWNNVNLRGPGMELPPSQMARELQDKLIARHPDPLRFSVGNLRLPPSAYRRSLEDIVAREPNPFMIRPSVGNIRWPPSAYVRSLEDLD